MLKRCNVIYGIQNNIVQIIVPVNNFRFDETSLIKMYYKLDREMLNKYKINNKVYSFEYGIVACNVSAGVLLNEECLVGENGGFIITPKISIRKEKMEALFTSITNGTCKSVIVKGNNYYKIVMKYNYN